MSAVPQLPDHWKDALAIRRMLAADLPRVVEVEQAAYEFPWGLEIFRECLRVAHPAWVYDAGDRLVGHGLISVAAGECHLLNVCVHPDLQRQGLGAGLTEFMVQQAAAQGAERVWLEVRISNRAARRLYDRLGFHEVGTRRGYYPARVGREDALVFARELSREI